MKPKQTLRPSPTALLNPRCDASFKAMFTQETEESNAALQDFISALLGKQVKELKLVPNEPPIDKIGEVQMSFDVSVVFDNGERADLEMQAWQQNYDHGTRAEIQAARLLNTNARVGDKWNAQKVYQISVLDFHYDKDDKSPIEWYTMRKDNGGKLSDRLNIILFDLVKIKRLLGTPPEKLSKLEKWGLFLSFADDETKKGYIDSIIKSEGGIMNASNALNKVSQDDINWARENTIFKSIRDYNTGMYNARQEGLEAGLRQGEQQKAIDDAVEFLKEGISPEIIAKFVKLPIEKVLELKEKTTGAV